MRWLRACYWTLIRFLMSFRYRVRVEGLEKLRDLRGPTLVMPNHPGLIDPPLVLANVRLPVELRPIVTTSMYRKPLLYPLMRLVNAVEVPDLGEHSRDAREQTLTMIDALADGLNRGESFLIYPAGRTERRGVEEIGATRAVADLLERCPQANIVLVRTRGIWGSIFTFAYTGEHPNLERCVLKAFGWMFAALGVFLPRRNVTMTVQRIDRAALPGIDSREAQSVSRGVVQSRRAGETDVCAVQFSLRAANARISGARQVGRGRCGENQPGDDSSGQRNGRGAAQTAAHRCRERGRNAAGPPGPR